MENVPTETPSDTLTAITGDDEQGVKAQCTIVDDLSVTIDELVPSSETDQDEAEDPVVEIEVTGDTISVDTHAREESTQSTPVALATVIHTEDVEKSASKTVGKSPAYQIVAGVVVRKDSRPSTPSKFQIDMANASGASTPLMSPAQSTASHYSLDPPPPSIRRKEQTQSYDSHIGRVRSIISPRNGPKIEAPEAAKKFVECGDMADHRAIGSLTRQRASWPGAPQHNHHPIVFGPAKRDSQDDAIPEISQFGYGKTTPINQPSVREETFDPFDKESAKSLKQLIEKNTPLLDALNSPGLKSLLEKAPNCFCGKMCARFDGIVPVYVCGCFRRVYVSIVSKLIPVLSCQTILVDVLSTCMSHSGNASVIRFIGLNTIKRQPSVLTHSIPISTLVRTSTLPSASNFPNAILSTCIFQLRFVRPTFAPAIWICVSIFRDS